ncbi:MAG: HAD-IA family hydrolase [Janthinobacterium lividum]
MTQIKGRAPVTSTLIILLDKRPLAYTNRDIAHPGHGSNACRMHRIDMTLADHGVTLSPRDYDAVLFDLDGVLTKTASVHACAWKKLFDEFLRRRQSPEDAPFRPFDIEEDYAAYVDGKPRYDGVASFLHSRCIECPLGNPDDAPGMQSRCALGNLKDRYFLELLAQQGVAVYESSIALVRKLRGLGFKTAVVSSSNNCLTVLEAAGITTLFDTRVDGLDIAALGLKGKPAPDAFLEAARRLGVLPSRAVVVEDAVAGVGAGRAGRFAKVIGIDRNGHAQALLDGGADIVISDLSLAEASAQPDANWSLTFEGFEPSQEGKREALCTLGNGYLATRASVPWAIADEVHYPGTYVAGGYNRLSTVLIGRTVENEDLVNFPNWLAIQLRIGTDAWFDLGTVEILSYGQELDLLRGMLFRSMTFRDTQGRTSTLKERRLVSMCEMHLSALELTLTAEDWSANVTVRSSIDGRVVNRGAVLYRQFNGKHLEPLSGAVISDDGIMLEVQTCQSHLHLAQATRTQVRVDSKLIDVPRRVIEEPGYFAQEMSIDVARGQTLALEKIATLYTSRDSAISECGLEARKSLVRAHGFHKLMADHTLIWKHLWQRFDVLVQPVNPDLPLNGSMLLRLNMFHLLQAVSPNSIGLDIGVPARGWTGEGYQGHIFWDELFIFPFFNYRLPEITRSLLMYRYRRLGEARSAATAAGYRGAMFPWQSASDGSEETEAFNLNPRSRHWVPDNSYLQRHVGSAVAYNVWQYFQVTHDVEFLHSYGAEIILDVASFWSSIASFNKERGRYEIHGVVGPDEFHDAYVNSSSPGVNNNAYTNIMAVWVICRALEVLELLPEQRRIELTARLDISAGEIVRWDDVSRRMFVPIDDDGIISQFEGYEKLRELDWTRYRTQYGNIQRLDLILEGEGDSANCYKLSKQPDTLMLFYLLSAEALGDLFARLGYSLEHATIPRNVSYYTSRSSDGSTLSRVVNAWVLARSDRPRSLRYLARALQSDVADIQDGTTAEGIHLGAMAGTVDIVQRAWTGLEIKDDVLWLNPELPHDIAHLKLRMRYRGHSIDLLIEHDVLTVRLHGGVAGPISLCVGGESFELPSGVTRVFKLSKPV